MSWVGEEGVVLGAGHVLVRVRWVLGREREAVGEAEGGGAGEADDKGAGGRVFVVELARGAGRAADEVGEGGDGVVEGVGEVAGWGVKWSLCCWEGWEREVCLHCEGLAIGIFLYLLMSQAPIAHRARNTSLLPLFGIHLRLDVLLQAHQTSVRQTATITSIGGVREQVDVFGLAADLALS